MNFLAQADTHSEKQNLSDLFTCIHCHRVSQDRSTWFEAEDMGPVEERVSQETICAECSKALFPNLYK